MGSEFLSAGGRTHTLFEYSLGKPLEAKLLKAYIQVCSKVPLRDAAYLNSRGCRKLKRNTGVPTYDMYMSLCEVGAVVPLLFWLSVYCAGAFEI